MASIANATIKGGFYEANGVGNLLSMSGENGQRSIIEQAFGTAQGLYAARAVMFALLGAAPGGAALKTRARVSPSTELGGVRAIETINLVNRVTTAADVTELKFDLLQQSANSTYGPNPPANLDRNPLGTR